jgi:membrane associated rhomboid family serine protease
MAFLQSTPAREPFLKAPTSVVVLIALLVAAHVGRMMVPADFSEQILNNYAFVPLRYSPHILHPESVLDRAIPFVSYIFLHADWMHLTFNCLWLLAFGAVVARRFRPTLFFLFFTICGVAAAATYLMFDWNSADGVIGASGAIAGLMGAGIRMLNAQALRHTAPAPDLLPLLSPQVLMFSAVWIGVNLIFGLAGLSIAGETHAIAWQTHLGGYFVGLLLAGPFDAWAKKIDPNPPVSLESPGAPPN